MNTLRKTPSMLAGAAGSVLVLGGFIALWWAASSSGWVNRAFLPSPQATLASLVQGLVSGDLAAYTWATLSRMVSGWVLASALGMSLGVLIGSSVRAREWIAPTLEFIRPLPASAVMPLAIALFGLSGNMVLAVVAFGAMWPVLLATLHGLANVHQQLREVSRSLELGHLAPAQRHARHPGRHAPVAHGLAHRVGGGRNDRLASRSGPGHPAGRSFISSQRAVCGHRAARRAGLRQQRAARPG